MTGLELAFPGFAEKITRWFAARGDSLKLAAAPVALPGGERIKNDFSQLEAVWKAIEAAGLCRHSYVVAVGGGAVLDLVGFAAATAHRGIPSCACRRRASARATAAWALRTA